MSDPFSYHPKFASRLSNTQKFIFVSILFWIALIPLVFFVLHTYSGVSSLLNREIQGNRYQEELKKLTELIPRHQALAHEHLMGYANRTTELTALQTQIQKHFDQLIDVYKTHQRTLFNTPNSPLLNPYFISPEEWNQNWKNLSRQVLNLSPEQSDQLHENLMDDLTKFSNFIGDAYRLINDGELHSTYLINLTLFDLPKMQVTIFQSFYKSAQLVQDHQGNNKAINTADRDHVVALVKLLEYRLEKMKEEIDKAAYYGNKKSIPYFISYENATRQLIQTIHTTILSPSPSATNLNELLSLTNNALTAGFRLWDYAQHTLNELFLQRKEVLQKQFWTSFILSLLLELIAFLFGFLFVTQSIRRLSDLTDATESFTAGNLSARVPITYHDEIGRLGVAFNRMAQRLKEMISQLYQLLEGTKALGNGDLSVRIQIPDPESEFGQVAQSFNNMAQTFETIIRRLQRLGVTLATSTTQMSMASKEQETIITEQESTTREIAFSANQISSSAKAFANTLKDVSVVADKTSNLASAGKASLSNMESIMQHMVEASTGIASKLAILNEKAGNITSVITTITKVADQTNLLSLNASIEAEKAGEYGRSFGVIAREIRRLADQTAVATLDIEKIVDEIMTAISSSVMGVDDFTQEIRNGVNQTRSVSNQLATIIEQVQAFTTQFESVNQGMQSQSAGAEQINEAITQLSQTAQQTTEAIHQFHRTIENLNEAAQKLNQLMPQFKTSTSTHELNIIKSAE